MFDNYEDSHKNILLKKHLNGIVGCSPSFYSVFFSRICFLYFLLLFRYINILVLSIVCISDLKWLLQLELMKMLSNY